MPSDFIVQINILLVDDHPQNLLSLEAVLEPLGANLVRSNSGEEALRLLLEQDFALILLDVQMPGMDGFETASLIRQRRRSRQTPIIFLTAFSTSSEMLSKGYSLGAVDYLHKPIDPVILLSKATVFVDLFRKTLEIQQQSLDLEQQANQLAAANAQLRQSEKQFRLLSEGSPIGIFRTDPQGNLTYTNPRFGSICGFTAPALLQTELLHVLHPQDQARLRSVWSAYLKGEQEFTDEFCLLTQEENQEEPTLRWINLRSRPLFSEQHDLLGHLGTIEDITERKQAEAIRAEMLREQVARQEAEATNRLKDEFLAVLSHELRTPLNAMMGWAKILSDSFAPQSVRRLDEATVIRGLSTIQRNAQAQTQLIEDLLDVSRIIQGKLTLSLAPVALTPILEAAIESLRPQAQTKNLQLTVHFPAQEITVQGDAVRLQQIVWNLISNAIKFTPAGGRVAVKLEQVEMGEWGVGNGEWGMGNREQRAGEPGNREPEHLPIADFSPHSLTNPSPHPHPTPSQAQLTITDTGIGISPDFLPQVFDRFRQADSTTTRSYTGLGLGLAIVRHLVELHGGTVRAASGGIGQGSTFTVILPLFLSETEKLLTREATQPSSHASSPHPLIPLSPHLSPLKILLVDDETDTRELLAYVLETQGATVTLATSVAQALEALAIAAFDLLISDISMPGMDGYDLIQTVRSLNGNPIALHNSALPAIALTAHASEADQQRALALGFQVHLVKPIEPATFIEAIEDLLRCNPK